MYPLYLIKTNDITRARSATCLFSYSGEMGPTILRAAAFVLITVYLGRYGIMPVAGIVSDTDAVYHIAVELALKIAHAEIKQQKTIDEYLFRKGNPL